MSVSGLAITLGGAADAVEASVQALRARPGITLGERVENRLAITVETDSTAEDRDLVSWIGALPGVEFADVVFVAFEEGAP